VPALVECRPLASRVEDSHSRSEWATLPRTATIIAGQAAARRPLWGTDRAIRFLNLKLGEIDKGQGRLGVMVGRTVCKTVPRCYPWLPAGYLGNGLRRRAWTTSQVRSMAAARKARPLSAVAFSGKPTAP